MDVHETVLYDPLMTHVMYMCVTVTHSAYFYRYFSVKTNVRQHQGINGDKIYRILFELIDMGRVHTFFTVRT